MNARHNVPRVGRAVIYTMANVPIQVPPNRLRELREGRDLKPYDLAAKLRVDPSTIYRWERDGGIPDPLKLELAEFFGVTGAYLMGWPERVAA